MSNLAQEEADRMLNNKTAPTSHPEDRHDSDSEADDEKQSHRGIRSSRREDEEDQDTDDDDTAANMATMTSTKTSYTLPSTAHYANTGPKGVIADAQNYHRARRSTFRRTLHSISDTFSFSPRSRSRGHIPEKPITTTNGNSSGSDIDLEDDDEFMHQWRQQRLAELQDQYSAGGQSRTRSPNRRTYGTLEQVDANGYLNAIENVPKETNVVVLLFDSDNKDSNEVEDELKTMAYRWSHIKFVKLHHEIAEMQTVDIPAILAYKGGDVFATISGAEREGLEGILRSQGVLNR
ncbi:hypothetical protein PMZ80_008322 [Knufia obscura]|uniref:Phosducin domain-containing protein n=2 Tax=Knufia TaxID=430999 RepID=A0AAN8EHY1_9EURO|nr:hypothetical protein PMZ80_008322 [Knufia obscura]KAK5951207.1 hypothetical protein OHC33_007625 [Knufia fluminis]